MSSEAERQREAEVVLIIVDRVTEDTVKLMERVADESADDARALSWSAKEFERARCCVR